MAQFGEDSELDTILEEQHNTSFKSNYGNLPFWRLIILLDPEGDFSFTASFIFYHGIGDGMAGLMFHKYLRTALDTVSSSSTSLVDGNTQIEVATELELLPPLEQLHPLPINENPTTFRKEGLEEWTGKPITLPCTSRYRSLYLSSDSTAHFSRLYKSKNLTVTAGLHAVMAGAMFAALPSTVEALTGIIPVNLRPWLDLSTDVANSAMGSFIDAMKVQTSRSDYDANDHSVLFGLQAARQTSRDIKNYLEGNSSPSGEPYTSIAFFKAIPDVPAVFNSMVGTNRDAAFEVSNLGCFSIDGDAKSEGQWCIRRMTFSRSAVAFGAALTTSVVSGGDGALTIGFSWQEGVVDDSFVDLVIGKVRYQLRVNGS